MFYANIFYILGLNVKLLAKKPFKTVDYDISKIELQLISNKLQNYMQSKSDKPVEVDYIPLHKGSKFRVAKKELVKIYSSNPEEYAFNLANLIFGEGLCSSSTAVEQLDPEKMASLTSEQATFYTTFFVSKLYYFAGHVVQIFRKQGVNLNKQQIERFLISKIKSSKLKT